MPRQLENLAICPFYSKHTSSPGYACINCIAGCGADGVSLRFRGIKARDKWYNNFCSGKTYMGCVIYQAIETLQEDEP